MEKDLRDLESFEESLSCLNTIRDWVVGRLSQQNGVFSGIDFELLKNVPPNSFHIVPVLHNTVLHRIVELQDALDFLLFSQSYLISNVDLHLPLTGL